MTTPNLSEAVLKPCPFCGNDAIMNTIGSPRVVCPNGDCGARTLGYHTEAAAIAAWNRRDAAERGGDAEMSPRARELGLTLELCDNGHYHGRLAEYQGCPVCLRMGIAAMREKPIEISDAMVEAACRAYDAEILRIAKHPEIIGSDSVAWRAALAAGLAAMRALPTNLPPVPPIPRDMLNRVIE